MGPVRSRRVIAELAEQRGLGRVVRVYRPLPDSVAGAILLPLTFVALVPAGLAVFYALLEDSPWWRWIVLGWSILAGVAIALFLWGPTRDRERRLRYATAEHGLLVWSPDSPDSPDSVRSARWHELRVSPGAIITWEDGQGEHRISVWDVLGRRDLVRAVRHEAPVRPLTWKRTGWVVLAASCTALVVWFAGVPVGLDVVLGERPRDLKDFERICEGGRAYGRAAAYEGSGPHPIAVYEHLGDGVYLGYPEYMRGLPSTSKPWPPPDNVQLVGCSRLTGLASGKVIADCAYHPEFPSNGIEGSYQETWYQGRHRVDVYEARTGRKVDTVTVDGDPRHTCATGTIVSKGTPRDDSVETGPRDRDYAARLARLFEGEAER